MKKTLFGRLAKLQGRIRKYLKKSRDTKRFILTMVAVWTVIPALSVNAAGSNVVPAEVVVTNVTIDQNLQIEKPKYTVEVRTSPRQVAKQAAAIEANRAATQAVTVSIASTETTDPGMDVKRQWTQKAASTWNIDWKLLEAVWQVETGKTWYTSRGSSAGARGPLQFMPGTWRGYAQDGNGDGVKNVNDARDSLFAAAKLLAVNGAASGNVDGALLRYNHSLAYVAHVKRIAASIGG
ncbi:MAG: lytic transglycosylase domain-containing protein [Patescibacteria group bacterium]